VLVELSVMEQRYQAVLAVVQDGWRVVEVARRVGVSRQATPK
jgi:transposase-like protein